MKITTQKQPQTLNNVELCIVPVFSNIQKSQKQNSKSMLNRFSASSVKLLKSLDEDSSGAIFSEIERYNYQPQKGKKLDIRVASTKTGTRTRCLRLYGMSSQAQTAKNEFLNEWRLCGGYAVNSAKELRVQNSCILVDLVETVETKNALAALTEGAELGAYEFCAYKSKRTNNRFQVKELTLFTESKSTKLEQEAIKDAQIKAQAQNLVRDLVNTPASDCTPNDVVRFAKGIANTRGSRLKFTLLQKKELERLGANALLGVSRGSETRPVMVRLNYAPARKTKHSKRIVLIGKGVTFDSGGLSIKTGKGMEDMKCDMAGAATVISTMSVLAKLGVEHEVCALAPLCENLVSAKSLKPGDVVSAINGKTIEVLNTDAEGRLILADALSYSERLSPDVIIDLATLTGACVAALGHNIAGLFGNDEALLKSLEDNGKESGETIWPLPLAQEYKSMLDSQIADIKNIGTGSVGAIIGALFLEQFVPQDTAWAHIDIAGPAFVPTTNEYTKKGATGFGVRLLASFLQN